MRIAVVTSYRAPERINFFREVDLVKAASLYANSIEVLSFSSLVYTDWGAIPEDQAQMLREAIHRPDNTDEMPTFKTTSDRVAADSGVNGLLPAIRERLVTVNDSLPRSGDVWGAFVDEMIRYFNDPTYVVLLDDLLGEILAKAIRDGRARVASSARASSAEAVIGAGLIARLPAFTEIPMSEVLDLRRDLNGPLVRYRSAVSRLRTDEMDPFSRDREAIVDQLWRQHVAPALLEIEDALTDHGLVRELARSLGADIRSVVSGMPLRASVAVGLGAMTELAAAVQTVAASVVSLAPPVMEAYGNRNKARTGVARSDFYYLYRLNRS